MTIDELPAHALPVPDLRDVHRRVLRVLSQQGAGVKTRDLAVLCGLVMNEVRWACERLMSRGLVSEGKRRIKQACGDKKAFKIVSVWCLTEQGRDVARALLISR